MAPMKRAASKAAGGKKLAKKCKVIEHAVREADSLPKPVRRIIAGRLVHVFTTYKEERHAFQNTVSALVGQTLKATETNLQAAIDEANQKKAAEEAQGAALSATNDQATGASQAAAQAAADAKAALNSSSAGLRDAKSASHNAETAVKTNEADTSSTAAKKEKLEALIKEFFTPVKEGTLDKGLSKSASWVGKHLGKEFGSILEKEYLTCVVRTYSQASASWGTFDHIVAKELEQELQKITAGLVSDLQRLESEKATCAAEVENCKAAVSAAAEAEKAAEDASKNANAAAKEAKATATKAASTYSHQNDQIKKADQTLGRVAKALNTFKEGAVAAYAEVAEHTAPPPPPEPVAEAEAVAQPSVAAAMAPAPAVVPVRTFLPSPAVLFQGARNLLTSPRVLQSPTIK